MKEAAVLDVLVLHDADNLDQAEALTKALAERGLRARAGDAWAAARVAVTCGDVPTVPLRRAIEHGTAVLPLAGLHGWLEDAREGDLAERLVEGVVALLRLGARGGVADEAEVERALAAIDARRRREAEDLTVEGVCGILALAIERGAPIFNAGSVAGCARIYLHTARGLAADLEAKDPEPGHALFCLVLTELVDALAGIDADPELDAEGRAWALRRCYDRILMARHTAEAVESLDTLFEDLRRAGRPLTASLAYDVISLAVSHGAPVYNAGSHGGCARIYLCCARGLLERLPCELPRAEAPDASPTEALVRSSLPPLLDEAEVRLEQEATELAWDLRHAFDAIVAEAADERSWEHDS